MSDETVGKTNEKEYLSPLETALKEWADDGFVLIDLDMMRARKQKYETVYRDANNATVVYGPIEITRTVKIILLLHFKKGVKQ